MQNNYQGNRYLENQDYRQGELTFRETVTQNPNDPLANYYLGRFLLAQNKAQPALPYLKKAASLDRKNTDYLFWQGVAQGELGESKMERESYRKVLALNANHVQALTYLGHNQFKAKEYEAALITYNKVLGIWPNSPSALYNRALIARILKDTPEEKAGWLAYLNRYPAGDFAIKATGYLNRLGDFSYQNHDLGGRATTLTKIWFEPLTDKLAPISSRALNVVGATATNMKNGKLQVVVFQQNNKDLAKARAISIRQYLLGKFPGLTPERIGISWFDEPEEFEIQGKKIQNPDSVRFFFTDLDNGVQSTKKKTKKK
ncbi:MAG: tetratricopeptide repeat protein [Desulforhopalus sp.]|nr:tetratricopeptide repeat protein [Desulforhopalus sp.]